MNHPMVRQIIEAAIAPADQPKETPVRNTIPNLALLYAPSSSEIAKQLPDVGDGLAAKMAELARAPEPFKCEELAYALNGAAKTVMALRAALIREAA